MAIAVLQTLVNHPEGKHGAVFELSEEPHSLRLSFLSKIGYRLRNCKFLSVVAASFSKRDSATVERRAAD